MTRKASVLLSSPVLRPCRVDGDRLTRARTDERVQRVQEAADDGRGDTLRVRGPQEYVRTAAGATDDVGHRRGRCGGRDARCAAGAG